MNIGIASRDITPEPGLPLSGFAARLNQLSVAVDDPLRVRALAVADGGHTSILLVFDLLGLGPEFNARLHAAFDAHPATRAVPPAGRLFCTTHTHSAPATICLRSCGQPEPGYEAFVAQQAVAAAAEALARRQPATLRFTHVNLQGLNYNRRRVLVDGRVVMAQEPDAPIRKAGPTWDEMLLARFDAPDGRGIAGLASWAAHPILSGTLHITADYPGRLCRGLAEQCGFPFLYLQGPCGNLNPPFRDPSRNDVLGCSAAILSRLRSIDWPVAGAASTAGPVRQTLALRYAPGPPASELHDLQACFATIAQTGTGPAREMQLLANILNVRPGDPVDPGLARHIATALHEWTGQALAAARSGTPKTCDLACTVWQLGDLTLAFVAAEVFAETALQLRALFPQRAVHVVAYASPLVGYLPTAAAVAEGGYESEFAYRFYGHHAPFTPDAEQQTVQTLAESITTL